MSAVLRAFLLVDSSVERSFLILKNYEMALCSIIRWVSKRTKINGLNLSVVDAEFIQASVLEAAIMTEFVLLIFATMGLLAIFLFFTVVEE
jgi:hypothetical protein